MTQKPTIEYPCAWEFRLMGADAAAMESAVAEVLGGRESYTLAPGNRSPAGRWCSISLRMQVENEVHRDEVHRLLREHPAVRMVL
jgi:putative lipoic acid-binding regulatory protein